MQRDPLTIPHGAVPNKLSDAPLSSVLVALCMLHSFLQINVNACGQLLML